MPIQFVLNDDQPEISVECYRQLNLLAHAQLEETEIGSRCGGHGICGGDRIKVESGRENLSPPTAIEKTHLSPQELGDGWRLACQCFPSADQLTIRIQVGAGITKAAGTTDHW